MNRQTYAFLNSARVLYWEWLRLRSKRDELQSCLLPAAIRYDKDKVQSSPEDAMSKIVAEIGEIEKRMAELQQARSIRIDEIYNAINKIESAEERTALTMRYINRIAVPEIAKSMGYSVKRIYQFMDNGGDKIAKEISLK